MCGDVETEGEAGAIVGTANDDVTGEILYWVGLVGIPGDRSGNGDVAVVPLPRRNLIYCDINIKKLLEAVKSGKV